MAEEIERRYNEKQIREQTYKNNKSTLVKLRAFKPKVFYYEITSSFFSTFSSYLIRKHKNSQNTVWSAIKDLKTYLALATKSGIVFDLEYLNFPTGKTSNRITYLEDDELKRLYLLYKEESLNGIEQKCLRAFLFQTFTSLRISDVFRANWSWVNNTNDLHFIPYKNERFRTYITVPLSKIALELIESKRGAMFDLPAEQTINEKLKLIALHCNIYKTLTTHVGRHTFGTLFYRHTKDLITLSKIMGHAKIQQTMVYAHINDQDKRDGVNKYETAFLDNVDKPI
ncbi:MAG: hypothetical protein EOP44_03170 [Sphingobacteriaceae bacterium]|nr:MAG: hypothetical protein EOP44_03170 [Sphingobacteriaceae bacterium]